MWLARCGDRGTRPVGRRESHGRADGASRAGERARGALPGASRLAPDARPGVHARGARSPRPRPGPAACAPPSGAGASGPGAAPRAAGAADLAVARAGDRPRRASRTPPGDRRGCRARRGERLPRGPAARPGPRARPVARMQAVVVAPEAPGGLAVGPAEAPLPGRGEALVRVAAISLNPGA